MEYINEYPKDSESLMVLYQIELFLDIAKSLMDVQEEQPLHSTIGEKLELLSNLASKLIHSEAVESRFRSLLDTLVSLSPSQISKILEDEGKVICQEVKKGIFVL